MSHCKPSVGFVVLFLAGLQLLFAILSFLFTYTWNEFVLEVIPIQARERIVCDAMTAITSMVTFLLTSRFTVAILLLIMSVLRILLFVEVASLLSVLLLNKEKMEVIATLSWQRRDPQSRSEFMLQYKCCGLKPILNYPIPNDFELCASTLVDCCYLNATVRCCNGDVSPICPCFDSCLPHIVDNLWVSTYIFLGIGCTSCILKPEISEGFCSDLRTGLQDQAWRYIFSH
ncbi:hypothetical protein CRM22_000150 [Opisthorchis felineus]|uniref:Tetraspanin n=1 Tax=Opisthorchis felineus TaxID=147828 RepID=A0A4S2MGH5_OPIFE|nr:hypothetical protein CRM22_000150 [Opisthorchis felineus]